MRTITRGALERNEQDREEFRTLIKNYFRPESLVFADESHFNRLTLRRSYAWSIGYQERACRYDFSLRGNNYFILPALSHNGLLHPCSRRERDYR